jgi:DNA invertase Pin-like site-specific DNA recombinase
MGLATPHMADLLVQLERHIFLERTHAGMALARERGVKFGRPHKLTTAQREHARKLMAGGKHTATQVAELLGVSRATIYRRAA